MPLESPIARDGDAGFIGFASRLNPVALPPGMLQLSENMRLDRGTAKTRKGVKRLADGILPAGTPLTIPFVLTTPGPVVSNSYTGGIFAGCAYRSPSQTNSEECIVLAGASEAFVWQDPYAAYLRDNDGNIITDHLGNPILSNNFPATIAYPGGETISPTDTVSMLQAFDRLYLLREAWIGEQGFENKSVTSGGITVVGTTATVNSTAHGYTAGMRVRIEGSTTPAFDGVEYDIASATTNSFAITVPSGTATDATATGRTVRRVKAPLYWDGVAATFTKAPAGVPTGLGATYKTMRSVGFAAYINNRMWLPDGRDQVAVSDYLDADTYDAFWQSFRANQGSNDYIVAIHPWREGAVLIFMRHSIWLAEVNQFASTDGGSFSIDTPVTNLALLTSEVGCVARRTIQTAGNFVYFLSDAGVHRLDTQLDLKLQGNTLPLSDPISDIFDNINGELADDACGLYFNNRYYLSLPIDGALVPGQAAKGNNTLLIYSQLNGHWESKDTYGAGLDDLLVSAYEAKRRMHAVNRAGKLFLLEEMDRGDDVPDSTITGAAAFAAVPGRIKTRRYGFGNMQNKRFIRSLADVVLPDTASITVKAHTANPDGEITLVPGQTNTSGLSEDYTLKNPIRAKAHYAELEFITTAERPEIRNVSIEAATASLPQTDTRHAA
jgi:hypothetical protein